MSHEVSTKIIRRYRIKESILKEKLGMVGDIEEMVLYSGLSMKDEEAQVSHDKCIWEFKTVHTSEVKPEA